MGAVLQASAEVEARERAAEAAGGASLRRRDASSSCHLHGGADALGSSSDALGLASSDALRSQFNWLNEQLDFVCNSSGPTPPSLRYAPTAREGHAPCTPWQGESVLGTALDKDCDLDGATDSDPATCTNDTDSDLSGPSSSQRTPRSPLSFSHALPATLRRALSWSREKCSTPPSPKAEASPKPPKLPSLPSLPMAVKSPPARFYRKLFAAARKENVSANGLDSPSAITMPSALSPRTSAPLIIDEAAESESDDDDDMGT